MAVHQSAIKRQRQNLRRRAENREIKSRIRTLIKKTRQAVEVKDVSSASLQLREVNKALGKAVTQGILKANTASRWMSRLARSVHRISATS